MQLTLAALVSVIAFYATLNIFYILDPSLTPEGGMADEATPSAAELELGIGVEEFIPQDIHSEYFVQSGRTIYETSCVLCHGSNGDRVPIAPLNSKAFLDSLPDSSLVEIVSGGLRHMHAMGVAEGGRLTGYQVKAVTAYLRHRAASNSARAISKGQDLYVDNCLRCHGGAGDAVPGIALASAAYLQKAGDGNIIAAIYDGGIEMPAYGKERGGNFGVLEVAALLGYLKSRAGLSAITALPRPEAGIGEQLFDRNCSPCHGPSGDRVPGVRLKSPEFLEAATDGVILQTMSKGNARGMPAWGRNSGGPLTESQTSSILVYLKSVAPTTSETTSTSGRTGDSTEPRRPEIVAWGRYLFQDGPCAHCHKNSRDGVPAARLHDPVWLRNKGDRQLAAAIAEGRGAMPAWGKARGGPLEDLDIRAIIAYLQDAAGRQKED